MEEIHVCRRLTTRRCPVQSTGFLRRHGATDSPARGEPVGRLAAAAREADSRRCGMSPRPDYDPGSPRKIKRRTVQYRRAARATRHKATGASRDPATTHAVERGDELFAAALVYLPVSLICCPISDSWDRIHDAVGSEADAAPQYMSICHSGSATGGESITRSEPSRTSAAPKPTKRKKSSPRARRISSRSRERCSTIRDEANRRGDHSGLLLYPLGERHLVIGRGSDLLKRRYSAGG